MNEEQGLRNTIEADPFEGTGWGAIADFLNEQEGRGEEAAVAAAMRDATQRREMMAVQTNLMKYCGVEFGEDGMTASEGFAKYLEMVALIVPKAGGHEDVSKHILLQAKYMRGWLAAQREGLAEEDLTALTTENETTLVRIRELTRQITGTPAMADDRVYGNNGLVTFNFADANISGLPKFFHASGMLICSDNPQFITAQYLTVGGYLHFSRNPHLTTASHFIAGGSLSCILNPKLTTASYFTAGHDLNCDNNNQLTTASYFSAGRDLYCGLNLQLATASHFTAGMGLHCHNNPALTVIDGLECENLYCNNSGLKRFSTGARITGNIYAQLINGSDIISLPRGFTTESIRAALDDETSKFSTSARETLIEAYKEISGRGGGRPS